MYSPQLLTKKRHLNTSALTNVSLNRKHLKIKQLVCRQNNYKMLCNALLVRTNTHPSNTTFMKGDRQQVLHFSSGILEAQFF